MNAIQSKEYGIALLRISLGVMFIAHSVVLKLFMFGLPGTAGYFESIGLPAALAYVVFGMEAVGGILLVLGVRTREVSAALIPILAGALHRHHDAGHREGGHEQEVSDRYEDAHQGEPPEHAEAAQHPREAGAGRLLDDLTVVLSGRRATYSLAEDAASAAAVAAEPSAGN